MTSIPDRWRSLSRISECVKRKVLKCPHGIADHPWEALIGRRRVKGGNWTDGLQCDPEPGYRVDRAEGDGRVDPTEALAASGTDDARRLG